MTDRCPFTGRPADENHHLTGRGPDGAYLDPDLTVPLSRVQHNAEHVAWTVAGLDRLADCVTVTRLRRAGHLLVRLGEALGAEPVVIPTATLLALGRLLLRVAREMDR